MTQMLRLDSGAAPLPPGEVLKKKLLDGLNLTQAQLARAIGISRPRLNMMLKGRCQISAEIALRIERVFDISPNYWLRARDEFELFHERQRISRELEHLSQFNDRRALEPTVWRVREWQAAA